ncbi:uncharacterized protein MELLADRAFT_93728 [Melampsora larici-populina 98AG31]|uniref:DNA ligase ATP-dependent N-terminal domain-containing protein n=1 Tax=Melampsora larici-populina (strain 98AG31 / pathotype 3-4-7) TaxID=747676 RepID=F4S521_MELLP|nr:uncharacterized protein MELLADRAFT_93728 [Melampsora larici-populina 98AG31]EGG00241.1 hypothetical protein MELLADRAFT_93728 [Melampsora larici-populina 98AG31]
MRSSLSDKSKIVTHQKSIYAAAKKLKENTGIGWVKGECQVDMPQEWWNNEGMKHQDALQFHKHAFIFFDQMDELLHFSKPTGSLRTGTSSNARVKAKKVEDEGDEDDQVGKKSCDIRKKDEDLNQEVVGNDRVIVLDGADSSKINVGTDKAEETANPTEPISNKVSHVKQAAPSKPSKQKQPDSDDSDASISLVKPAKTNNKKKAPAREVTPGTLANAIAATSTDSVLRTQKLLDSKAAQSAERDTAIAAAARIRSERHAHQQEAIAIFNVKSKVEFPDVQNRLIAIDVIAEEREAALFAGLDDEMAWIWLKNQISLDSKDHEQVTKTDDQDKITKASNKQEASTEVAKNKNDGEEEDKEDDEEDETGEDLAKGTPIPYATLVHTFTLIDTTTERLEITKYLSQHLTKLCPDYERIELGIGESILVKGIGSSMGRTPTQVKADFKKGGYLRLVAQNSESTKKTMFKPTVRIFLCSEDIAVLYNQMEI